MKYTKKPVTIEALQFDGSEVSAHGIQVWAESHGRKIDIMTRDGVVTDVTRLVVPTLEGPMNALAGWWIIRGVEGEFYPCKPSVFDASYSPEAGPADVPKDVAELAALFEKHAHDYDTDCGMNFGCRCEGYDDVELSKAVPTHAAHLAAVFAPMIGVAA